MAPGDYWPVYIGIVQRWRQADDALHQIDRGLRPCPLKFQRFFLFVSVIFSHPRDLIRESLRARLSLSVPDPKTQLTPLEGVHIGIEGRGSTGVQESTF
jgi:hypothetical protein